LAWRTWRFLIKRLVRNSVVFLPNFWLISISALVTNTNVSLTDMTSGIMGLGFPRLSSFPMRREGGTFFVSEPSLYKHWDDQKHYLSLQSWQPMVYWSTHCSPLAWRGIPLGRLRWVPSTRLS
jgi:hypothetical protein